MAATAESVLKPDFTTQRKHFIFTDEHEQLRESIRSFAPRSWRRTPRSGRRRPSPTPSSLAWASSASSVSTSPRQYGGQGGDYYTSLVLAEEITHANSGGLSMGVAVHTDMAMPPILAFGTEEQKQEWVVPAIKGQKILSLGITEPDAGSDVSGIKTRAVRDGDDYIINGSKTYITNGHRADVIVLVTKTDADAGYDGFTLFLVPMDAPGVIREKRLEKLGMHASDTALLAFQDVRVPATAVLGEVGKGFYHIMWELQGERLIGAAGCVAGAQKCFEKTLQYAHERKAFGREIGKFQVIRHKFAEMATKIESARQMVYVTAWRFNNGEYPVREISMAKLHAARIALRSRRRMHPDPRRRGLHARVRRRARVARHAPEPHRRGHRRDHARRHRALLRAVGGSDERAHAAASPTSTRSCASLRSAGFIERELAPHAEQWEQEHWFPDEVFRKIAAQGLLGLKYPAEYGGQGGDYLHDAVLVGGARADRLRRHGRRARRARLDRHAADLEVRHRGAEAALPRAGDPRRDDRRARHHRAGRRLRRRRDHAPAPSPSTAAGSSTARRPTSPTASARTSSSPP